MKGLGLRGLGGCILARSWIAWWSNGPSRCPPTTCVVTSQGGAAPAGFQGTCCLAKIAIGKECQKQGAHHVHEATPQGGKSGTRDGS